MVIQNQFIFEKMHITFDTRKNIPCFYYKHQIYVCLCIFVFFVMQSTKPTDKELNVMKDFYWLVGEECSEKWFAEIWRMR